MKHAISLLLVPLLAALAGAADTGKVKVIDEVWHDATRNRDVPVRIYQPVPGQPAGVPLPIVIFSHGLGGSREGYEYLGRYWAEHGYFAVHVQHAGSDGPAVRAGGLEIMQTMNKAAMDPQNLINRPKDVSFAIDRLEQENGTGGEFAGLLDLKRIGVAGHSFGAYTTLAIAGQQFGIPGGRQISFTDKRVKAAIAMSETPPLPASAQESLAQIQIPMMHLTGTQDTSPIGREVTAADRRKPFDAIVAHADQYLITFDGARHLTFAGVGTKRESQTSTSSRPEAQMRQAIQAVSLYFWDAYLKDDPAALKDMRDDGLKKLIRPADRAESKLAK